MENKFYGNQEKIADVCKLPKDIVLGASIITMTGNRELTIENYKGVIEYQSEKLLLQGKRYQISIIGKELEITYYTKDEMKVCGTIQEVRFL